MNPPSIVRYWHAVELLQPQAVPKLKKRDSEHQPFYQDIPSTAPMLPWVATNTLARQKLPKDRAWSHTLYAHLYNSAEVAHQLEALYGATEGYKEPQDREVGLYALKFSAEGVMIADSLVLSSEAWFLGRALNGLGWAQGFDEAQHYARGQANELLGGVVTPDALADMTAWVRAFLGLDEFFGSAPRKHRFRSAPINPKKPQQEDDPLNSFLLADLEGVACALERGEVSEPLKRYLRQHDESQRLHLDHSGASVPLIERLAPARYAPGCWPTGRHLGLVHSQQLAVNSILETLGREDGVLGVNGPPGTGKTTLLRDLIAAVVTQRADVLAGFARASDAFIKDGREPANDGGRERFAYTLVPELFGFEMVVASSNNGAVENVTLELPQRDSIDPAWLPEAEYFSELGELISGGPAWGMISAALGSKANRNRFVERFFWGKRPPKPEKQPAQAHPAPAEDDDLDTAEPGQEDAPDTEAPAPGPKGFRGWLKAHVEANRALSSNEKASLWRAAVARYNDAKREEARLRSGFTAVTEQVEAVQLAKAGVAQAEQARQQHLAQRRALEAEQAIAETTTLAPAREALQQQLLALQAHLAKKPGFMANLLSLWGTQRAWAGQQRLLASSHALAESAHGAAQRQMQRIATQLDEAQRQLAADEQHIDKAVHHAQSQIDATRTLAEAGDARHLLAWLNQGAIGRGSDIELREPWVVQGWRQARAKVFIEALALHRTLFELEATRLGSNLDFITSHLTGGRYQGVSKNLMRSAWASLFMAVPVLSSTFASFARSFGSFGCGEIGWLLVDEAGQATPQAAVGALWRARRAVLVGDPLQLKPIVTVSDAVLEHMRTCYGVGPHWLPNRQSAQTLADQATPWGRLAGPVGQKSWVGLPLVVHRRCDRPMFDLANRIAYDGAMVYGTLAPSPEKETPASLPTGWLPVAGRASGNWVPAEGQALEWLLARLERDGVAREDIAVITPFQDVRNQLKECVPAKSRYGTIHTMQGKEAAVVILVLGGNSETRGARDWAVSEPNLLNVAATRARRRLYVIGDQADWQGRPLFCDVVDVLPAHSPATPAAGSGAPA